MLAAAIVALVWANSSWSDAYHSLFEEFRVVLSIGSLSFDETLGHFINEGLMAVFFFVVGLEIKRELSTGELRDPRAAALPAVAAVGGMLVPAAIYVAITSGLGGEAASGWAIPMATDIAFAVGVLALLSHRVPSGAKLFILALAIADDLGAIVVIALFYSADLEVGWLVLAAAGLAGIWVGQRAGVRSPAFYVPVALAVWFATFESGVHATLAGVALGFLTPAHSLYGAREFESKARTIIDTYPVGDSDENEEESDHEAELLSEIAAESISPLSRLEHRLLPWSSYVIVPLFALANAGVDLRGANAFNLLLNRVALGVAVGLLVGKTLGITAFAWLAVRLGWGRLPEETTWSHVVGLATLAGIGFTVSLFITNLAFTDPVTANLARVGILAGSLLAGVVGSLVILWAGKAVQPPYEPRVAE